MEEFTVEKNHMNVKVAKRDLLLRVILRFIEELTLKKKPFKYSVYERKVLFFKKQPIIKLFCFNNSR